MNPRDPVAGVGAPGTRKHLVKTVPDRLEPPQEPTGYPTLQLAACCPSLILPMGPSLVLPMVGV